MTQIPIYRTKRIYREEWVEGDFLRRSPDNPDCIVTMKETEMCLDTGHIDVYMENIEIDINTLSINFENMTDKNGKKIFASLSEDGVGGDIIFNLAYKSKHIVIMHKRIITKAIEIKEHTPPYYLYGMENDDIEIIGIHKDNK